MEISESIGHRQKVRNVHWPRCVLPPGESLHPINTPTRSFCREVVESSRPATSRPPSDGAALGDLPSGRDKGRDSAIEAGGSEGRGGACMTERDASRRLYARSWQPDETHSQQT